MTILLAVVFLVFLTGCGSTGDEAEKEETEKVEEIGKEITLRYPWEEEEGDGEEENEYTKEPDENEKKDLEIKAIMEGMTLEEKICQLFMVTPEQITGSASELSRRRDCLFCAEYY